MTSFQLATYVILWVVVAILFVLLLLLYRQYGLMLLPAKVRIDLGGLDLGRRAPEIDLPDAGHVQWASQGGTFILLAMAGCPICASLWNQVGDLVEEHAAINFYWIDNQQKRDPPLGWHVEVSADEAAHRALALPAAPYGYFLDTEGVVVSKGLINSVEQIAEMIQPFNKADGSPKVASAN